MDALRFASTKIQPPRLRSARIARPRLEARLRDALLQRRVVLLLAPAGFGKTCALAAQFELGNESRGASLPGTALAWVSLDEDDDAQRLFACLVAALEPFDLPWRTAPEALLAQLGESEAGARRAVTELVNALAATEVPHGVIVLDDVHRVQTPEVHALLDRLIERLPAHWTLVLSTRAEPPLALARLRVADELAEFGQLDLRFDTDEANVLASVGNGVTASVDDVVMRRIAELYERTQGWPAGLRLCLAALRSRAGRTGAVGGLSASGSARIDHHLFDYLAGEVLDDMPAELHDFLLRCSVLPALTNARCAAVSGDPLAADRLDEVERRGLFVTALDAQVRTLVLHDLFREALDDRLRKRLPDELPQLLKRAAAGEDDPLRRVGFLLRAGDYAAAEAALTAASEELMLGGAAHELRRAVEQFPPAWRDASARLLQVRTLCLSWSWEWGEMARSAEAAIAAARAAGDDDARRLAQTHLASAWYTLGRHDDCVALLDELRPQTLVPPAREIFLSCECSALFRRGQHERLPGAFAELLDTLERGSSRFTWWTCSPSSSWITVRGMRALIDRYCRGALQRAGERELEMQVDLRMLRAWVLLWAGEFDAALAEAEATAADARWLGNSAAVEVNLLAFHAIGDAMRGRTEPVAATLETLLARTSGMASHDATAWVSYIASFAVRMHSVLGSDAAELEAWARRFANGVPDPQKFETEALSTACYSARHAAAQQRWADAAELYLRVLPLARTMDTLGQGNELHLRAAHALLQCGRLDDAARPLAASLARIATEGERGHALMCGAALLRTLADTPWGARLAAPLGDELRAIAELAQRIRGEKAPGDLGNIDPCDPRDAAPAAAPGGGDAAGLSARERQVLERIAAGDSNKVIARVLDISPHTVKRHVGNILDKLGLASRGQAAAWLRENA